MRTLTLLRHAKAMPARPGLDDHARPLAESGLADVPRLARHLIEMGQIPTRTLCSSALRTRQTWMQLAESWNHVGHFPVLQTRDDLYLASAARLLDIIAEVPDTVENLMVIGHNPGLHQLALMLAHPSPIDPIPLRRLGEGLPTCTAVVLEIEGRAWAELREQCAVLTDVVRPRDLPAGD